MWPNGRYEVTYIKYYASGRHRTRIYGRFNDRQIALECCHLINRMADADLPKIRDRKNERRRV